MREFCTYWPVSIAGATDAALPLFDLRCPLPAEVRDAKHSKWPRLKQRLWHAPILQRSTSRQSRLTTTTLLAVYFAGMLLAKGRERSEP
ncbi:hypothetical protein D9M69_304220 [compost metagenome]